MGDAFPVHLSSLGEGEINVPIETFEVTSMLYE